MNCYHQLVKYPFADVKPVKFIVQYRTQARSNFRLHSSYIQFIVFVIIIFKLQMEVVIVKKSTEYLLLCCNLQRLRNVPRKTAKVNPDLIDIDLFGGV